MSDKTRVIICGAAGSMGQWTAKTVLKQKDMELVGCVDVAEVGKDIGDVLRCTPVGVKITDNLEELIKTAKADVMIDFTRGAASFKNIMTGLNHKLPCVVGTTGISKEEFEQIERKCKNMETPVFTAPNFSIGAVLMMRFAQEASPLFEWGEIIELHHNKKADAPSGTALTTAEKMYEERGPFKQTSNEVEKLPGARGGMADGIRIHSVRLPGLLAHQLVLLSGVGETLTIRHDSISRECYMPGVMLAVRRMPELEGLVVGLESIL